MSATLERIDEYFRDLERAVTGYKVDGKAAQEAEQAIKQNYAAALKDVEWNHRERVRWRQLYYDECVKLGKDPFKSLSS